MNPSGIRASFEPRPDPQVRLDEQRLEAQHDDVRIGQLAG